jgi:hypothetical protein
VTKAAKKMMRISEIDAQKNFLPPQGRDLRRRLRRPAAADFKRRHQWSAVTGLASPDRRRANPSAISRAINSMSHNARALMTLRP